MALRQDLIFFNFSATEGKGDNFCYSGVPTMKLEHVQQVKELTR
jgi:hypothetical protein